VSRFRALAGALGRVLDAIALACFCGVLLGMAAQVLFRYVLQVPLLWTEDLARVLFVVSMFLGMAIALREREHIVVDFLLVRIPGRLRQAVLLGFDAAVLLLLLFLLAGAVRMVGSTWSTYLVSLTWVRNGHLYLVEAIAICLMLAYLVADMGRRAAALAKGRPA